MLNVYTAATIVTKLSPELRVLHGEPAAADDCRQPLHADWDLYVIYAGTIRFGQPVIKAF